MEKPMETRNKANEKETFVLIKLYEKGKLGTFPKAENRLRAGLLFARDFKASLFSRKMTRDYDKLFVVDGGRKDGFSEMRCDAADRYLRALNFIGAYGVYARHFLRDEQNVRSFLARYPVLNCGSKRTYRAVYLAINRMLDKLVDFYDREKR